MIKNINAKQAWQILLKVENSTLVDVRTEEEWKLVGVPDLSSINKEVFLLSWQFLPDLAINYNFISTFRNKIKKLDISVIFICRSGYRSLQAAQSIFAEGYLNCYNIEDGFEGSLSSYHHRNAVNGWKFQNLPWVQD